MTITLDLGFRRFGGPQNHPREQSLRIEPFGTRQRETLIPEVILNWYSSPKGVQLQYPFQNWNLKLRQSWQRNVFLRANVSSCFSRIKTLHLSGKQLHGLKSHFGCVGGSNSVQFLGGNESQNLNSYVLRESLFHSSLCTCHWCWIWECHNIWSNKN